MIINSLTASIIEKVPLLEVMMIVVKLLDIDQLIDLKGYRVQKVEIGITITVENRNNSDQSRIEIIWIINENSIMNKKKL